MADPRTQRRRKNRRRARRAFILDGATGIFDRLEPRLLLATDVWTGAVNGNWSNSGNWLSGSAPSAGDDLDFPSDASNLTNTNDFAADTHFNNITIDAAGYTLGGNEIDLDGDISATYGSGTSTLSADLALQSSREVNVASGGALVISGATSRGPALRRDQGRRRHAGVLGLVGQPYNGTTTVNAGTLLLAKSDGVISANGSVIVGDHTTAATLQLGGSDQFWVGADVTVNQGSTFDVGTETAHISNLESRRGPPSRSTAAASWPPSSASTPM